MSENPGLPEGGFDLQKKGLLHGFRAASADGGGGKSGGNEAEENNEEAAKAAARRAHSLHADFKTSALGEWWRGVYSHGDEKYFSFRPQGERDKAGNRQISDKQLKEAISRLILEEGCTTIYCYRGNKIDPQLTARAEKALQEMMRPGHFLHKRLKEFNDEEARLAQEEKREARFVVPRVSSSRMDTFEPFRKGITGMIGRVFDPLVRWNDERKSIKGDKKVEKKERFLEKRFT